MSALERVARRIGMQRVTLDVADMGTVTVDAWRDTVDATHDAMIPDAGLRTYLLTSDRPLRVQVEYRMDSEPVIGPDDVLEAWYVSAWSPRQSNILGKYGATLDAAIIALAERIEGEGRE